MDKPVIVRTTVVAVAVSVACGVPRGWADPIIYNNLSYITGEASISQSGTRVLTDGYSSGQTLPVTGAWVISDGVAVSQLGATAAASGGFDITVSPNLFSGGGGSSSSAASADASGTITAEAWSQTLFGVLFQVTEPMVYDYVARFVGNGQLEGVLWPIDPASGLPSRAALFYDSFGGLGSIDRTLTHSGVLMPGFYSFHVLAGSRAFSTAEETSAFDSVRFALAPDPIPEPATLLLVGAGLVGGASGVLRRGRRRTLSADRRTS